MKKRLSILLALSFILVCGLARADVKGRFLVTISNAKDKPLKDVVITLKSTESSGVEYKITSDKKGKASLAGVDPIMYDIIAEKEGYQHLEGQVKLRAGVKVKLTWTMQTLEDAKATAVQNALDEMSPEERARLKAKDEHNAGYDAYEANDIESAKKHFLAAIESDPDVSYLDYLLLGQFAFNDKEIDTAIKYLIKARDMDTDKTDIMNTNRILGASYMVKGDYENAKKYWSEFAETSSDPMVLYNLANIEIHYKDWDNAIAWLEKCRAANPEYVEGLYLLGDLYIQQKQLTKALVVYKEYLALLQNQESPDAEKLKNAKDTVKLLKEMEGK